MEETALKSGTLWGPTTGRRKGGVEKKKEEKYNAEVRR